MAEGGFQEIKGNRSIFGQLVLLSFVGFNLLMIAWIYFGLGAATEGYQEMSAAEQAGTAIGTSIGAVMIFLIWAVGDVILGIPLILTRPSKSLVPLANYTAAPAGIVRTRKKPIVIFVVLLVGLVILGAFVGKDKNSTMVAATASMSAQERAAKIASLEEEAKGISAGDYNKSVQIYSDLQSLDPDNQRYREKVAYYTDRKDETERMKSHPEHYVTITEFSWSKQGFGSVMEVTLTIKNALPVQVKDIEVKCTHSAPSGTVIDSNQRTIYEVIGAGKTKTFRKFNMGFIHSQAVRSGCEVVDVKTLG